MQKCPPRKKGAIFDRALLLWLEIITQTAGWIGYSPRAVELSAGASCNAQRRNVTAGLRLAGRA